eukprot:TRINITY_DN8105_c0_g1_i4.p1 TRINITY_DN8105_c0_g1~~TRINITY_DN8105_c0_g1_i4.p1  ORF type:complete len:163 (-),score=28.09 TRINITY_DN8105_c0_g1_i4:116-604(-)
MGKLGYNPANIYDLLSWGVSRREPIAIVLAESVLDKTSNRVPRAVLRQVKHYYESSFVDGVERERLNHAQRSVGTPMRNKIYGGCAERFVYPDNFMRRWAQILSASGSKVALPKYNAQVRKLRRLKRIPEIVKFSDENFAGALFGQLHPKQLKEMSRYVSFV